VAFLALKTWGMQVYVRSSFTVVNLHDLRSNYPRTACYRLSVRNIGCGATSGQAQILMAWAPMPPSNRYCAWWEIVAKPPAGKREPLKMSKRISG